MRLIISHFSSIYIQTYGRINSDSIEIVCLCVCESKTESIWKCLHIEKLYLSQSNNNNKMICAHFFSVAGNWNRKIVCGLSKMEKYCVVDKTFHSLRMAISMKRKKKIFSSFSLSLFFYVCFFFSLFTLALKLSVWLVPITFLIQLFTFYFFSSLLLLCFNCKIHTHKTVSKINQQTQFAMKIENGLPNTRHLCAVFFSSSLLLTFFKLFRMWMREREST